MTLFEDFKNKMITNQELTERATELVICGKSKEEVKSGFSAYLTQILDSIYENYLMHQKSSGQDVIADQIARYGSIDFDELDRFFLSISQSRKSRAGKAFELTIEVLLRRLGYPFSDQVVIDGAKPDYVLPSEQYFRDKPLDSIILTAKRTLRERWRQVVTEANKGYGYYLATIDERISSNQIAQAESHKIYIIVPRNLKEGIPHYNSSYSVLSFEQFFENHLDPALIRRGLSQEDENHSISDGYQQSLL